MARLGRLRPLRARGERSISQLLGHDLGAHLFARIEVEIRDLGAVRNPDDSDSAFELLLLAALKRNVDDFRS